MRRITRTMFAFYGALLLGWLLIDLSAASAQAQGFTRGGTTFTPSGSGVRWPVTLVPTPGRPLGVSNLMLVPTPGTPPGVNLNLAPASSIHSNAAPSPGLNLGGFGAVLGGPQDLSGALSTLSYPSLGGVIGEPVTTLPYGVPITGTVDTTPTNVILDYGATAAPVTSDFGGPATGFVGGVSTIPFWTTSVIEPRPASGRLQSDVQAVLNRSSRLDSARTIQVATALDGLVLRGIVKDDHDRRLAEAMARLTPGVRELRNELVVAPVGNAPDLDNP
jgi:hypothetical protein